MNYREINLNLLLILDAMFEAGSTPGRQAATHADATYSLSLLFFEAVVLDALLRGGDRRTSPGSKPIDEAGR